MARTNNSEIENNGADLSAAQAWEQTAVSRKYGTHNGMPYVGAEGFIVPVPAPEWFASVPTESRGTVLQGLLEYFQNRIAQPEAKKKDATRESISDAVSKAVRNGFEPARTREKDIVDAEVDRQFRDRVATLLRANNPAVTDAEIDASVDLNMKTERGAAVIAEMRAAVLNSGRYAVQRKTAAGDKPKGMALEL